MLLLSGRVVKARIIPLPITPKSDWSTTHSFPVGYGFVAFGYMGLLLVWGGSQKSNPTRKTNWCPLPTNVVYGYSVENDSWEKWSVTGEIPEHSHDSAAVVCDDILYIYGGMNARGDLGDDIYALELNRLGPSNTAELRCLAIRGERPKPRRGHSGWSFEGMIYFFGGESRGATEGTGYLSDKFYDHDLENDNLLARFDPRSHAWTAVKTTGHSPSPRRCYGMAQLNDEIIIHGGWEAYDLYLLNMRTLTWSRFRDYGNAHVKYRHTLTPISDKIILDVGGASNITGQLSRDVCVIDRRKLRPDPKVRVNMPPNYLRNMFEPLPKSHFAEGMWYHQAVRVRKTADNGGGYAVICLGGFTTATMKMASHSNQMIVFDIE